MNAERLHAIALALKQEMTSNDTVGYLGRLCSAFDELMRQNTIHSQQAVADSLQSLDASFLKSPSDEFSPAWRQQLKELGGDSLFGKSLKSHIHEILERNQITPAVASKELAALKDKLESFQKGLDELTDAFKKFNIGDEQLGPGECEIGMLIPRNAVNNNLSEFAEELEEMSFVFDTFSEVATGATDDLSIKTISSTDLTVYLKAGVPYATCLAVGVSFIVSQYKQILEIKKLRGELLKQGVPEKETDSIEKFANAHMQAGIDKISIEIVQDFYPKKDDGRKHELENAVKVSLTMIANRIDSGYNFEVRVEPPAKSQGQGDSQVTTNKNIQLIREASAKMQFMNVEGPKILRLQEGHKVSEEKPKKTKGH